ncbi:sigma-70 family RNA polymerase sigma factor [Planococcus sp. N064]|uniref:Sigma-70 family RNA polymerase sigma factor n=1 Tax=Planococcus liqunii TaxID=3058394 RepID=A0ABT8MUE2_9BACL|nr:sigma-70 family RNA polymerase sigma factor [Planococcus sp. N064]MDN7228525.1 sigma-70 family RNA polymerase sigma factor [Planococcus sp. N064]
MEQLIRAAIGGQQEAFEQLIETEKSKLLSKAYSYVGNREDASDIVQETLLQAYKSIHQLKEAKYFSTWLFKILIRQCFAFLRQRKRTLVVETELIQQQLTEQEQPAAYEFVHEALSLLRKDYRTVLVLFYFYDFPVREIASLLDKPINTIKMHLHRGRNQLKKQLEQQMNLPVTEKEVIYMLKEQLAQSALNFVSIPQHYQLFVEDYSNEQAKFIWATDELVDEIGVTLDQNGKLIELTRLPSTNGTLATIAQQETIAEQFLTSQYAEALDYLSLSNVIQKEDDSRFFYEQYAGGYPLASYTTQISVSKYGEIVDFKYSGYTKTPPVFPAQLVGEEAILQQLHKAPWKLSLKYLASDIYSVPKAGLYPVYESPIVYHSFNALNGLPAFEHEPEEPDTFIPFPNVAAVEKKATIEEAIGVPEEMIKLQEVEIDENTLVAVWRERDWQAPKDKTMESLFLDRMEDTVKAKVDKHSGRLKEFMWFKERTGELDLSFEDCRDIACTFIATYFEEYLPYLQLKIEKPTFNGVHCAFFTFPLYAAQDLQIEGERFYVGVNRTTGFIDIFWSPRMDLAELQSFEASTIHPFEDIKSALQKVEPFLQWSKKSDENEPDDVLAYKLGQIETKQQVVGIDARTGDLIVSNI